MNFSAKNHLTATEICEILRQCGSSGVKELKFLDLHVTLAGPQRDDKDVPNNLPGQAWNPTEEKKNVAEEGLSFQEDQFAEMQILDPVAYEQILATRDFK